MKNKLAMRGGDGGGRKQVLNSTVKIPISRELWIAQPSSDPFQTFELGSCALIGSSGRVQAGWGKKKGGVGEGKRRKKTLMYIHIHTLNMQVRIGCTKTESGSTPTTQSSVSMPIPSSPLGQCNAGDLLLSQWETEHL